MARTGTGRRKAAPGVEAARGLRRSPLRPRRRPPPGAVPGTLVRDPTAPPPRIRVIRYGPDAIAESDAETVAAIEEKGAADRVLWINVDGLGDTALISEIGDRYGLHRLALADVVHVHQRPKVEEYDDRLFVVFRIVAAGERLPAEQISLFVGEGLVITFQERPGDCFEPVRARLRRAQGVIRQRGADYLAYALIDAALDGYFPAIESYDGALDELTDLAIEQPSPAVTRDLHDIKRELFQFRRIAWSNREMLTNLYRDSHSVIADETRVFLRDTYDHALQILDILEMQHEVSASLFDIFLSSVSNRLNEIMKVLTVIATLFIPLSFLTGLYGMNFDPKASPWNMPELGWRFGYPFALGLMAATAAGLMWWFRRRGWLGDGSARRRARRIRRARPPKRAR